MSKYENEKQNRMIFRGNRRKGGFTMAELLMTVAIILILSSLVFVGILQIVNHMKMMEMNQTAKQIFIAAQNHLTQVKAGGKLEIELAEAEDSSDPEADAAKSWFGQEVTNIRLSDGKQTSAGEGTGASAETTVEKQYYAVDQTGLSGGAGKGSGILSGMLPFGSIDETVRKGGSWIIQYEASTGTVQGVFYTDGSHGLFGKSSAKLTVTNDQESLQSAVRNGASDNYGEAVRMRYVPKQTGNSDRVIVGYYGGAEAKKLVLKKIKAPVVEIDNTNYLKVNVYDPNSSTLKDPKVKLVVKVHGETSNKTVSIALNTDQKSETGDSIDRDQVLRYVSSSNRSEQIVDRNGKTAEGENGEKVEKITGDHLIYTLVFDDITKKNGHFAQIFGKKGFLPGEDIAVTVSAQGENTELQESLPKTGNSLFESVGEIDSGKDSGASDTSGISMIPSQANISNTRNLENLDPNVSGLPQNRKEVQEYLNQGSGDRNPAENSPVRLIRKAVQTADIAWKYDEQTDQTEHTNQIQTASRETDPQVFGSTLGARGFVNEVRGLREAEGRFQNGIPTESSYSLSDEENKIVITRVRSSEDDNKPQEDSYYSIRNDQLREYDGGNCIIANMVIRDVANAETAYNGRIVKSEAEAGLFRGLYRKISVHDLILKNFHVKATDGDAGTLAGTISSSEEVTIDHVVSYGTEGEVSAGGHEITVNRNAVEVYYPVGGGLIGSWKGNGTVSDCAASVSVAGVVSGGLIGDVEDQNGSIEIRNSYSGGMIDKDKQKYSTDLFNVTAKSNGRGLNGYYYAGGLLGHVSFQDGSSVIHDCYSTCSVGSSDEKGVWKEIFVRGGLIGYLTTEGANGIKYSVKNSYAGGYVAPAENNDKAGAFLGSINGWIAVLSGNMYLPDINGVMPAIGGSNGFSHGDFIEKAVPEATQSRSVKTVYYNQRRTTYPFRTVTDAGERAAELERNAVGQALSDTKSTGVHFGDWVKPKKLASRYYLAYREGNRWFVYDPAKQKAVDLESAEKLENNKVIDNKAPKYGVLVPQGEDPVLYIWNGSWQSKYYNGWTLGKLKDEGDQDAIEIDGQEYDYFDFDIDQESRTGLIVADGNGKNAVNVETGFARAFWPYDSRKGRYENQLMLGSDRNDPIIIRTKKQLGRITDYPHRYYLQTAPIDLSVVNEVLSRVGDNVKYRSLVG
ncbi:type II secretion system protein [Eubacterium pyruvativorans]|uniref:type II secretion system protein n=1 Tax=Eubacterium pyruvativorans TaxID=155865 RepID=UPI003F8AB2FF